MEFNRVVGRNLKDEFFNTLDALCPGLMELFKKKRGLTGQILTDLLQQTKVNLSVFVLFVLIGSVIIG